MKTIASKFNLLTIFLIVLTSIATGSYIIWQHQINAFNSFTRHGEETAVMLAKNTEYGVYTENKEAINQSLQGLSQNPDIAYLVIYNKEKETLTQKNYHGLAELPSISEQETSSIDKKINTGTFLDSESNKAYTNLIAPVYIQSETSMNEFEFDSVEPQQTELIGYLQLGIDQSRIYQDSKQFMLQILFIVPIIIFFGILLTLWQTRRITRPIKKLVSASHDIAKERARNNFPILIILRNRTIIPFW
jgi:sensor histidine kinase regulating citrate/malate metabolism